MEPLHVSFCEQRTFRSHYSAAKKNARGLWEIILLLIYCSLGCTYNTINQIPALSQWLILLLLLLQQWEDVPLTISFQSVPSGVISFVRWIG